VFAAAPIAQAVAFTKKPTVQTIIAIKSKMIIITP
jgi:hypothetical protein